MITIVEVEPFFRQARQIWSEEELDVLKDHLARYPNEGEIMRGTGGVRKFRWGVEGSGKRGGGRVIYYYHSSRMPLFLLIAYMKNTTSDLTKAQQKAMAKLITVLLAQYRR